MQFFQTLKAQHISLLEGLPKEHLYRGLIAILALVMIISDLVVFWVFGDEILSTFQSGGIVFSETSLPLLMSAFIAFSISFEFLWIVIVAYITMRILKYLKTPLRFKHVCNTYLLIRVYELFTSLAVLLGTAVVVLATGVELSRTDETGGIGSVLGGFIIPVLFFWLYIVSVRYVRDTQKGQTQQKTS